MDDTRADAADLYLCPGAGRRADSVADALAGLVEAVVQVQLFPAVGVADRVIEFAMQLAQMGDAGRGVVRAVDAAVRLRQALVVGDHQWSAVVIQRLPGRLNQC